MIKNLNTSTDKSKEQEINTDKSNITLANYSLKHLSTKIELDDQLAQLM